MDNWTLQNAKARFSELVTVCIAKGPQVVTRHGKPAVVLIPAEDYLAYSTPSTGLKDFFLSAPRIDLEIDRSKDTGRDIEL